jgi:integrase
MRTEAPSIRCISRGRRFLFRTSSKRSPASDEHRGGDRPATWRLRLDLRTARGSEAGGLSLAYYVGSRREKQTFKGSLPDAQRKAREIANGISAGDIVDGLHLTPLDRRIYVTAKEAAAPTGRAVDVLCREAAAALRELVPGSTLIEAVRFHARQHSGGATAATPEQVISELYAHLEAKRRRPVTLATMRPIYSRFAAAFQLPIAHITTSDLERWLGSHVGHSPRTLQNYRAAIVRLFNFARGKYLPQDTPTAASRTEAPSDDSRGAVEIWKPWELEKILRFAPAKLVPCIALGAFAGLRTIELVRLEWSAIHFPDPEKRDASHPFGFVVVDKAAAKQHRSAARRIIPMQANLLEWLLPFRFKTGRISPRSTDAKLSALITEHIGTINETERQFGQPTISRPRNGLRHSYGSYRLPVLNDIAALALEMNNSPREIVESYRELALPRDVEAWWQIRPHPESPAAVVQLDRSA